jgi:predicted DNA-binding protein with PD1-like motif
MRSELLEQDDGRRTYLLVFDVGDEVTGGLLAFATENHLEGSHFTAVGAFQDVVLGWFDWDAKEYRRNPMPEQVEVVSFAGNITLAPNGAPVLHAHTAVAKRDGSAWGGHLLEAHVRPTLEVVLTESPTHLRRTVDSRYGIAFISTG